MVATINTMPDTPRDTLRAENTQADAVARQQSAETTGAISWAAVILGALVATAISLILLLLGSGLGLASMSAWPASGVSFVTLTTGAAVWLILVQWSAAALGGYLTGRLRSRWTRTHTHEVFFRDTAHGLAMWALATLIGVFVLAGAASSSLSSLGTAARAAGSAASGAAQGAVGASISPYDVDSLFRSASAPTNAPAASNADSRAEATHILAKALTTGGISTGDRSYLAGLIAAQTGVSPQESQKRVEDVVASVKAVELKTREAADTARSAAATASIYAALSMSIGAFIACAAAALGGHRRDEQP
jgi:hypothetical protein